MEEFYVLMNGGQRGIYYGKDELMKHKTTGIFDVARFKTYEDAKFFASGADEDWVKDNILNSKKKKHYGYVIGSCNYCDKLAGYSGILYDDKFIKRELSSTKSISDILSLGQLGGETLGINHLINYAASVGIKDFYLLYRAFEFYAWKDTTNYPPISYHIRSYQGALEKARLSGMRLHMIRVSSYEFLPEIRKMMRKANKICCIGPDSALNNIVESEPLGSPEITIFPDADLVPLGSGN